MLRIYVWNIFFICIILTGCRSSLAETREKGAAQVKLLLEELYKIETREDLLKAELKLKNIFESLVDAMIEARFLEQKTKACVEETLPYEEERNYSLQAELRRIYALEGGRECLERVQREAMLRLDAKEKMLRNQQQFRGH